jgi:uncharacterized protein YjgD (DUF1641 family)
MAQRILLDVPVQDPREELRTRLENAPIEHAEALLQAYEVLQLAHERGLLEIARGLLGSRDDVLGIAVNAAKQPDSIRTLRNFAALMNMLGSIDPENLTTFTRAVPAALQAIHQKPKPTGLWKLFKDFLWNQDFRHGLSGVNTLLESFGKSLSDPSKK